MTTKFEQNLNRIIANGADIEEKLSGIGVVWQTAKERKITDSHFDKEAKKTEKAADSKNKNLKKSVVNGEIRYYKNKNLFKTVKGHWFEIRKDGYEYAIAKSRYAEMGLN